jgi:hypothetical protein
MGSKPGTGNLNGVEPKFATRFSVKARLTAGKYAIPGPRWILSKASPMHLPFLYRKEHVCHTVKNILSSNKETASQLPEPTNIYCAS